MIERGGFNLLMNEMIWKIWKSIKSADVTIGPRANLSLSLSLSLSLLLGGGPRFMMCVFRRCAPKGICQYDVCSSVAGFKGGPGTSNISRFMPHYKTVKMSKKTVKVQI